jgi:hypothetical protein
MSKELIQIRFQLRDMALETLSQQATLYYKSALQ